MSHSLMTHTKSLMLISTHTCNSSLKTTIKSQYGGAADPPPPPRQRKRHLSITGTRGDFYTEGKENWGGCNHHLHKAGFVLFQHGQHVRHLHFNGISNLLGGTRSSNSLPSQISPEAWGQEDGEAALLGRRRFWQCTTAPSWLHFSQNYMFLINLFIFRHVE